MIRIANYRFFIVTFALIHVIPFPSPAFNALYAQEHKDDTEINLLPADDFVRQQTEQEEPSGLHSAQDQEEEETEFEQEEDASFVPAPRQFRIADIIVKGNATVSESAILHRIPYRVGEIFDPLKTRELIHKLYYDLRRFRNVSLFLEPVDNNRIALHIVVEEKNVLKEIRIEGNSQVSEKEIYEKIPLADMSAIDPEELQAIAHKIKKLYIDKGYHAVDIETEFLLDEQNRATAVFKIHERPKALIKRIEFEGNYAATGKELRNVLFSREDWILSFMDKSGTFQVERLEADRHMIEQFYQNKGYLNAKVIDVITHLDECNNAFYITFLIQEGDRYKVKEVSLSDIECVIPKDIIISLLPIQAGAIYSRQAIVDSMQDLEKLWSNQGYIFAHVEPSIIPDQDSKTVSVTFNIDPGEKVYLNRLNIKGNKKTRDKVIRRQIFLEEGGLLTSQAMDSSKARVESLGYFEVRDGVNWKITRLDENLADLDLVVNEAKTGNANFQLGYGGTQSLSSPSDGITGEINVSDTNLWGTGVRVNAFGRLSKEEKTILFNITQPWLFDKPIYTAFDAYQRRVSYEEFRYTLPVNEKVTGGVFTGGFVVGWAFPRVPYFVDTNFNTSLGIESINYGQRFALTEEDIAIAFPDRPIELAYFNVLRNKLFSGGEFGWFTFMLGQDRKNHPMHPTRGHVWSALSKFAFPIQTNIGFARFDLDYHWFTPLIGDFDLIFHFHTHLGAAVPFRNHVVPYRELFNIGGPASVRGYLFGQISPRFTLNDKVLGDPIGGSKALWLNAELIFPIAADMSIKGLFFYDGGAGWDNPYAQCLPNGTVVNNNFDYRHAVGVGVRILNPMPVRVDWGFKLDPRKREQASEVHFGMTYDWA